MPWWGWLIVGVLATLLVLFLVLWLRKKPQQPGLSDEERKKIEDAAAENVAQDLAIQKERNEELAKVATRLRENLSQLEKEFELVKGKIDEQRKQEFDRLASDNNALGNELDELLGIRRGDDTDPG